MTATEDPSSPPHAAHKNLLVPSLVAAIFLGAMGTLVVWMLGRFNEEVVERQKEIESTHQPLELPSSPNGQE